MPQNFQAVMTLQVALRWLVGEYIGDIVIFLYKVGEALLDTSIRSFISTAVCSDTLLDRYGDNDHNNNKGTELLAVKDMYRLHFGGSSSTVQHGHGGNFTFVCSSMQHLPIKIADDIHRQVAGILVVYRLLISLPAVILALFCGAWTDSRGCKVPMMTPSVGSCVAVILYLLSVHMERAKVALLLSGAAMQGVFGKTSVITMAVNSQVTHVSDTKQRTRRLGRLLASNYLGMFTGALLAGVLQEVSTLSTTLLCVSLCHALCVFAVLLAVTDVETAVSEPAKRENPPVLNSVGLGPNEKKYGSESNSDKRVLGDGREGRDGGGREGGGGGEEKKKKEYGLFSWKGVKDSVLTVVRKREGDKRGIIVICLIALTAAQILKKGDQDVTVMFVGHPPLSWPPYLYGYLIAADSGVSGLALLLGLPVLSDVLSVSDSCLVLLGLAFKLVRVLWAGFCTRTWMMFASVVLGAMGSVVNPGLRSMLSKTADRREVGKLFSIQASLETLAQLVGSALFTGIYAATVDLYPPAAYLAEVVVYLFMAVLLLWLGHLLRDPHAHGFLQLLVTKTRCCKDRDGILVRSGALGEADGDVSSLSLSENLPLTAKKGGGGGDHSRNAHGETLRGVSSP